MNVSCATPGGPVPQPMFRQAVLKAIRPLDVFGDPSAFDVPAGEYVDSREVTKLNVGWADRECVFTPCCNRVVHAVAYKVLRCEFTILTALVVVTADVEDDRVSTVAQTFILPAMFVRKLTNLLNS